MISVIFETKRFRVQITGKTAWVESKEGAAWIFRNQYNLPLLPEALRKRGENSVLRAALQHYEKTHEGDTSLREALTGVREKRRVEAVPAPARPPVGRPPLPNRMA